MKLKRETKFGKESICRFKIGIRNLIKFDPCTRKSQKIFILMGYFGATYVLLELKKYRGGIFHETEEGYTKFGEELTCCFKIVVKNLTNFDPSTRKSQKFSY